MSYHFPPIRSVKNLKEFITPISSREVGKMVLSNMAGGNVKCHNLLKSNLAMAANELENTYSP